MRMSKQAQLEPRATASTRLSRNSSITYWFAARAGATSGNAKNKSASHIIVAGAAHLSLRLNDSLSTYCFLVGP